MSYLGPFWMSQGWTVWRCSLSLAIENKGRKLCVCEFTIGMHRGQLCPDCCLDAVFVQMTLMGTYHMAQVTHDQDFTLSGGKERLVLRVCIVMPTYLPPATPEPASSQMGAWDLLLLSNGDGTHVCCLYSAPATGIWDKSRSPAKD